jgi:hypothetical protein
VRCPNCGSTFQLWDKACLRCGIRFLEFYERRAWGAAAKPRRPAGARAPRGARRILPGRAGLWLAAGLVLAVCAAAARHRAAPLPPRAFFDSAAELAFIPPPGWRLATDPGFGGRFRRVAELTSRGGRIVVEVCAAALPVAEHLDALILEEFNGRRPRLEAAAGVLVGGAEGRRLPFRADGGPGAPAVVGEAVFVPGVGRNYLIRFYSDAADFTRRKPDWSAFLASVRVRRR